MDDHARHPINALDAHIIDDEAYDGDIAYWTGLVTKLRPASLLELGCGSGRLLEPMARAGLAANPDFSVTGLDIEVERMALAAERFAADPELRDRATFVRADMTDFDLRQRDVDERATFDLIVLGFNGFGFLTEPDAQLECMRAVRRHLTPEGLFAIDLIVPQHSFLALSEKGAPLRMGRDLTGPAAGVRRLLRFDSSRYDTAAQIDYDTYMFEIHTTDGRIERATDDLAWKMTYPVELDLLARLAGLRVVDRVGSYDGEPFNRHSAQYLWTFARAD